MRSRDKLLKSYTLLKDIQQNVSFEINDFVREDIVDQYNEAMSLLWDILMEEKNVEINVN